MNLTLLQVTMVPGSATASAVIVHAMCNQRIQ